MIMQNNDTICGIASAMTNSGIGIIRISGPDAIVKADSVFSGKEKLTCVDSHTVHYGHIVQNHKVIDEVMVLVLKSPRTYTREDVVEIDCHGGVYIMQQILKALMEQGVRVAEPGEFTKRAFLNGRIDLSQAESVMDLIESRSQAALSNSMNQLQGVFSEQVKKLREAIIYEIAYIESALDDPEHYQLDGYYEALFPKIEEIYHKVCAFADSFRQGTLIKEGIRTVIIGKPNAGKSSLLNFLAKKDRAIVTDIAGTTRDVLEEQVSFYGMTLRLMDTAGIHETEDVIEKIGVEKSYHSIREADLILYVIDASIPLDENDDKMIDKILNRPVIALLNKSDLSCCVKEQEVNELLSCPVISFSVKTGEGAEELKNMIKEMFFSGNLNDSNEIFLTNERHAFAMLQAKESLFHVMESMKNHMPEDFLSIDLMDAYMQLGYIVGEAVEDDLINEIFSKFCTGK